MGHLNFKIKIQTLWINSWLKTWRGHHGIIFGLREKSIKQGTPYSWKLIFNSTNPVATSLCWMKFVSWLPCYDAANETQEFSCIVHGRFSEVHEFEKPNDEQALNLMNSCAMAVLQEFQDVIFSYGVSDEYRYQICSIFWWLNSLFEPVYVITSLVVQLPALFWRRILSFTKGEPGITYAFFLFVF